MKLFLFVSLIFLSACASEIKRTSIKLEEVSPSDAYVMVLLNDVEIMLSSGYARKMKSGSRWQLVGHTKNGAVFKPMGTVLTVEGAHIREAYLTIKDEFLVGFYIPGEDSYSPLSKKILLPKHKVLL